MGYMTDTPEADAAPESVLPVAFPAAQINPEYQPWEGQPPRQVRMWAIEQVIACLVPGNKASIADVVKAASEFEAYVIDGVR